MLYLEQVGEEGRWIYGENGKQTPKWEGWRVARLDEIRGVGALESEQKERRW